LAKYNRKTNSLAIYIRVPDQTYLRLIMTLSYFSACNGKAISFSILSNARKLHI